MIFLCRRCGAGYDADHQPPVDCGHNEHGDWTVWEGDPVDLAREQLRLLELDPALHANKRRDFGRGFSHAIRVLREHAQRPFTPHEHWLGEDLEQVEQPSFEPSGRGVKGLRPQVVIVDEQWPQP